MDSELEKEKKLLKKREIKTRRDWNKEARAFP